MSSFLTLRHTKRNSEYCLQCPLPVALIYVSVDAPVVLFLFYFILVKNLLIKYSCVIHYVCRIVYLRRLFYM